jgi:hypothetical protein
MRDGPHVEERRAVRRSAVQDVEDRGEVHVEIDDRRLHADRNLRPGLDPSAAADLLWTMTSLRTWEDLVQDRGWSAQRYQQHVTRALRLALTRKG